jgi:folate-binding protein YgfZ
VGPDVRRFANGMLTNNVRDLAAGHWQSTARADDRGRLLGLFDLLMMGEDHIRLVAEGVEADEVANILDGFLFADDVELVTYPDWACHTVQGGGVRAHWVEVGAGCPTGNEWLQSGETIQWARARSAGGGVDILGPRAAVADWVTDGRLGEPDERGLEYLRMRVSQPRWPNECHGVRLPQELGISQTHLSFDKGCYVGQEIIHRLQMRGQVRRGLRPLAIEGSAQAPRALRMEGKVVGELTSLLSVGEDRSIGLGLLKTRVAEAGTQLEIEDSVGVACVMEVECVPDP